MFSWQRLKSGVPKFKEAPEAGAAPACRGDTCGMQRCKRVGCFNGNCAPGGGGNWPSQALGWHQLIALGVGGDFIEPARHRGLAMPSGRGACHGRMATPKNAHMQGAQRAATGSRAQRPKGWLVKG